LKRFVFNPTKGLITARLNGVWGVVRGEPGLCPEGFVSGVLI